MEALQLPIPTQWVEPVWVGVQILLILLAGYLAQRFVAKGLTRLGERYPFPPQLLMPLRGGLRVPGERPRPAQPTGRASPSTRSAPGSPRSAMSAIAVPCT